MPNIRIIDHEFAEDTPTNSVDIPKKCQMSSQDGETLLVSKTIAGTSFAPIYQVFGA
jgi:hypothetical protein